MTTATSTISAIASQFMGPFAQMFDVLKPLGLGIGNAMSSLLGIAPAVAATTGNTSISSSSGGDISEKTVYDYLTGTKGLSPAHAKGLLANMLRESSLDIDAVGDGGNSFGLFQWNGGRGSKMKNAVPNWATNWMGQIDYALSEQGEPGQEWMGMQFSSPQAAADWWMREWERPADISGGSSKHSGFIRGMSGLGGPVSKMMNGGIVPSNLMVQGSMSSRAFNSASTSARINGLHDSGSAPIVVSVPSAPASSGATSGASDTSKPPALNAYPNTAVAMDYIYRQSMSSMLS
jgi:hypothetical protein